MLLSPKLEQIIEALLFAAETSLSIEQIKKVVEDASLDEITFAISELNKQYENRPFYIQEIGEGYRLLTKPEFAPWIEKMHGKTRKIRLSQAALETLAIIAYKQPITRAQIAHIRGVDSSGIVRKLLELNLIAIKGRSEEAGRPTLYATSQQFLEHLGLRDLSELPRIDELEDLLGEDSKLQLGSILPEKER